MLRSRFSTIPLGSEGDSMTPTSEGHASLTPTLAYFFHLPSPSELKGSPSGAEVILYLGTSKGTSGSFKPSSGDTTAQEACQSAVLEYLKKNKDTEDKEALFDVKRYFEDSDWYQIPDIARMINIIEVKEHSQGCSIVELGKEQHEDLQRSGVQVSRHSVRCHRGSIRRNVHFRDSITGRGAALENIIESRSGTRTSETQEYSLDPKALWEGAIQHQGA